MCAPDKRPGAGGARAADRQLLIGGGRAGRVPAHGPKSGRKWATCARARARDTGGAAGMSAGGGRRASGRWPPGGLCNLAPSWRSGAHANQSAPEWAAVAGPHWRRPLLARLCARARRR